MHHYVSLVLRPLPDFIKSGSGLGTRLLLCIVDLDFMVEANLDTLL